MNFYGKIFIMSFRTALGELVHPQYTLMYKLNTDRGKNAPSFFFYVNVYMIWIIYFVHTYFLNIIMLNFMIAVMMSTYDGVVKGGQQEVILYKHKAELNFETHLVISKFMSLQPYRAIVFQTMKKSELSCNDDVEMGFTQLRNLIAQKYYQSKVINEKIDINLKEVMRYNKLIFEKISENQRKVLEPPV